MAQSSLNGLALFKERNFRWFFIGQAASLLGDGMIGVALAFAVLDQTGSPADLGFVLAARSIPMVAVLLIGGVFADRLPRRHVMVAADVARFLSLGTMCALLISGHASIWELAALQVVDGTAAALFTPASIGLMPSITTSDRLQEANAFRGIAISLGSTLGPALSGVLIAATSPGWVIAVDAATFAVSAIMLSRLRLPAHNPPPSQSFLRDLRGGWTEFRSRNWLWGIVVLSGFTNMLFAAFIVLGPAVAKASLGGASAWATIMATFGAGSVLGGLAAFRLRPRRPLLTSVLTIALLPLPTLGIAAQLPMPAIASLAFFGGFGATMFNVVWETQLQRNIPHEALSRVSAYDWFASFACQPVGQAMAGPAAVAIGIYPFLWLAGVAQLVVTLGTLAVPAIRSLPALEDK